MNLKLIFSQLWSIMRISVFLLFVSLFQLYANVSYSQEAKISISESSVSLHQLFNQIEKQSEFLFFYVDADIEGIQVNVHERNASVNNILDKALSGTSLGYEINDRHITIAPQVSSVPGARQTITVSGTISDENRETMPGVNVVIKGTTIGTVTDINGKYSVNVPNEQAVLQFSFVGYMAKEIQVLNQHLIDVVLVEDRTELEEIVVIGYGTQKKADLTGSVANVNAKALTTQSNSNVGQALQGKIAGVDIVSQGGTPGAGTRIMIRGIGTLNNSSPLYIVDGMYMGDIDHINPNDIESIDVLKDASSSAIYGSRAANGVVIVTTKGGSNTEGKPIIDISANIGVQSPTKYLDLLNAAEWAKVTTLSRQAVGLAPMEMAQNLDQKPDNDWQDIMMGPALMQNYNISIKGGGNTYTYYTGIGYFNQDGTIKGTGYERYTAQFKSDYRKGWFSAGNNMVFTKSKDAPSPGASRGGMIGTILQSIPTLEQYDDARVGGYGGTYGDATDIANPLGWMDKNLTERSRNNTKIFVNLYAQVEFLKGLKYKFNMTPDFHFYNDMDYQARFDFGLTTNSITQLTRNTNNYENMLVENLLTFDRTFGDHKVSALAGYTYQNNKARYQAARGQGMPDGIIEIDAATKERVVGGSSSRSAMTSILSRIFYSYKSRYLITATLRRDGSSKFGKNNRYGNFPSASVGWNIAEESFLKPVVWLNQLKLRGGYGVLGNQEIANYQYASLITSGINYPDGAGALLQGAFPKDFATPAIKWEETTMSNIGVDFIALRNRLSFTADVYIKKTKDILLNVPIPISTGGANDPIRNAGEIENKGFEFAINWNDRVNEELSYGTSFIGNVMKNEVSKMGTGSQAVWGGATNLNVNTSKTMAGYPIGGFWLIPADGYFQNDHEVQAHQKNGELIQPNAKPGDIRFMDTNDDGKINDDDRTYQGSAFPKFTMSINGNIAYKNLDAMISMQGVFGNKIYNASRQALEGVNKGTNYLRTVLDYWTPDNPDAAHPRLIWDDPNRNNRPESDRYVESGSFFRIRSIQVGYTFPKSWFGTMITHSRLYFNVENPFMFTKYKGYTPDINTDNATYRGFDNFTYPINRVFMLGLNVTF